MQNNNNNNNLHNGDSPTPFVSFETAWAGLKPELDKEAKRREKKKRRFIIFWFCLIAIGLGLGGLTWMNNHTNNTIVNNTAKQATNNSILNNSTNTSTDHLITEQKKNNIDKKINTQNNNGGKTVKKNIIQDNKPDNESSLNTTNKHTAVINKKSTNPVLESNNNFNSISINTSQKVTLNHNKKEGNNISKSVDHNNFDYTINKKENNSLSGKNSFANPTDAEIKTNSSSELKESSDNSSTNLLNKDLNSIDSINKTNASVIPEKKDSIKHLTDTLITRNNIAKKNKSPEKKTTAAQSISYGLQFNVPFGNAVNFKDINSHNQPATVLIPTVWVSKQLSKKHSISLQINPYAQFYLNNKAVIDSSQYNVTIFQGALINNGPEKIKYKETIAFNKAISIEATLLYNYQLNKHIQLGAAISNNWIQGALMQNKVIRNYSTVIRDSLYGINNKSKEWSYLKPSFMLGKIEAQYQIRKLAVGLSFSAPLNGLFTDKINYTTPVNKTIFIKWKIK